MESTYTGQIRALHRTWIISYTDGKRNLEKKLQSPQELVDFCNDNSIKIMNQNALIDKFKKQLKFK